MAQKGFLWKIQEKRDGVRWKHVRNDDRMHDSTLKHRSFTIVEITNFYTRCSFSLCLSLDKSRQWQLGCLTIIIQSIMHYWEVMLLPSNWETAVEGFQSFLLQAAGWSMAHSQALVSDDWDLLMIHKSKGVTFSFLGDGKLKHISLKTTSDVLIFRLFHYFVVCCLFYRSYRVVQG